MIEITEQPLRGVELLGVVGLARGAPFLAAFILAIAAALKLAGAAGSSSPWPGEASILELMLITAQAILAAWLVSGYRRRGALVMAVALFGCFTVVSLRSALLGKNDCGCFGAIQINPWITAALDLAVVLLLIHSLHMQRFTFSSSRGVTTRSWLIRAGVVIVLIPIGALAAWVSLASRIPPELPATWLGKPLPFMSQIDIGPQLSKGRWVVLFHRSGCSNCRDALHALAARPDDPSVGRAVIELDPHQSPPQIQGIVAGKLAAAVKDIPPGLLLELEEGIVTEAHDDKPSVATSQPRIVVEDLGQTETVRVDVGFIRPEQARDFRILICNSTAQPIKLRSIDIECSCTSVTRQPQAIDPQSVAPLDVTFVAPRDLMVYTKHITIRTDSPTRPKIVLEITARIGLPLMFASNTVYFGEVPAGGSAERIVEFRNDDDQAIQILGVSSDDDGCRLDLKSQPLPPRSSIPVTVRLDTLKKAPGSHTANLEIRTDHTLQKSVILFARYTVTADAIRRDPAQSR